MTKEEHDELNAFCHEHVMDAGKFVGLKKRGYWYRPDAHGYTDRESEAWHLSREEAKKHEYPHDEPVVICEFSICRYTTDTYSYPAMAVLQKCIEVSKKDISFCKHGDKFRVFSIMDWSGQTEPWWEEADSLPLAICLYAKKMFSK